MYYFNLARRTRLTRSTTRPRRARHSPPFAPGRSAGRLAFNDKACGDADEQKKTSPCSQTHVRACASSSASAINAVCGRSGSGRAGGGVSAVRMRPRHRHLSHVCIFQSIYKYVNGFRTTLNMHRASSGDRSGAAASVCIIKKSIHTIGRARAGRVPVARRHRAMEACAFFWVPHGHTHTHPHKQPRSTAKNMSALSEYFPRAHTFKMLLRSSAHAWCVHASVSVHALKVRCCSQSFGSIISSSVCVCMYTARPRIKQFN